MNEVYTATVEQPTAGILECLELFEVITKPGIFNGGTSLDDLANMANAAHKACEQAARAAINHARDCGETLLMAKRKAGHGKFEEWVRANCAFSERMARNYMVIAKRWPQLQERQRVADLESLSIREALQLLSRSTVSEERAASDGLFHSDRCPACRKHMAEIEPGVIVCVNCFDSRIVIKGRGERGKKEAYYAARNAWKQMSPLDRQKFLEEVAK